MRVPLFAVVLFSLIGSYAWGDQPVTANQGSPGKQGCWPVCTSGSTVVVGPDGGSVPVNITQSIPIQVFMDGGQHVIADQGAPGMSPWACYVAMDGGQQIIVNQGTSPWSTNVSQWGGTATTLGQKAMAASVPVVIASDQSAVPVSQSGAPWSVSGVGDFNNASVSPTGVAVPASATYCGYNDGTDLQGGRVFDEDTGGGTQFVLGASIRVAGAGGSSEAAAGAGVTTASTLRCVLPTDQTSIPAAQSGTWSVSNTQVGTASQNVAQWGGVGTSLGQKVMASSVPVTLASDQTALSVTLPANQSVNIAQVAGTATVTGGLVGTLAVGGTQANDTAITANPMLVGFEALSTQPVAATSGNIRRGVSSVDGVQYTRLGGPITWTCSLDDIGATLTECQPAPGAGLRLYLTDISIQATTSVSGDYLLRTGTGANCGTGTVSLLPSASVVPRFTYPGSGPTGAPGQLHFMTPIQAPTNTAMCIICVAVNTCVVQLTGFVAP